VRRANEPFRRGLLRRRAPTLREWCAYWLDTDAAKRPKTRKEDSSSLERHVFPTLGDVRIDGQRSAERGCVRCMPDDGEIVGGGDDIR